MPEGEFRSLSCPTCWVPHWEFFLYGITSVTTFIFVASYSHNPYEDVQPPGHKTQFSKRRPRSIPLEKPVGNYTSGNSRDNESGIPHPARFHINTLFASHPDKIDITFTCQSPTCGTIFIVLYNGLSHGPWQLMSSQLRKSLTTPQHLQEAQDPRIDQEHYKRPHLPSAS